MAIVERAFINTGTNGIAELKGYIEECHPDFFDSLDIETSGSSPSPSQMLACKKSINDVVLRTVKIGAGSNAIRVTLYNKEGTSIAGSMVSTANLGYFRSTEHGFIVTYTEHGSAYKDSIIVVNDNNGLSYAGIMTQSNGPTYSEYHANFETTTTFDTACYGSASTQVLNCISRPGGKTMVIPTVFASGVVTDKLLRIIYNEHIGVDGVFELNGKRYITDGYFAIPE